MSNSPFPSVGGTLSGGIQDISALLPILGTEQCEIHVGSALEGGYLYAATTPLSIFGSLGIVKAGLSILFSSISISIPRISLSFRKFKPTITYSQRSKWLGARIFSDAGFELSGAVAPLIGMDGQCFKAETRLLEILKDKHIDDPEKISIDWKSKQWNIMLVFTTILAATLSLTPYVALILGPPSWQPTKIHLPWLYPALRTIGSCFATVACQFIIQYRVISIMKNRIIFMAIDQEMAKGSKAESEAWLNENNVQWDPNLPAEQCLWSLEKTLSSCGLEDDAAEEPKHISIPMLSPQISSIVRLRQEHFQEPIHDTAFIVLSWIILGLSVPATVAGYIGCFTLVSSTPSPGNGPLIWVGLEAALSILRIVVWASNPSFDEETEVTVALKLSKHQPMVTSDDYNPRVTALDHEGRKPFTLIPEREFLERITPFTGPLDQFQKADNITLYFTLTTDYGRNDRPPGEAKGVIGDEVLRREKQSLFMTVFDFNMRVGGTLLFSNSSFNYFGVSVKYNAISTKLEAIESDGKDAYPWDDNLFDSLKEYYRYVVEHLSQRLSSDTSAILPWKWGLTESAGDSVQVTNPTQISTLLQLSDEDRLHLNSGYEHHLKTNLIATWGRWIVMDMQMIRSYARNDCYEALIDGTSESAQWELTELDVQLVWEWARRELVLVRLSLAIEDILNTKMENCISVIDGRRKDTRLMIWMRSEFKSGQKRRVLQERRKAEQRMERAMKDAREQAGREERSWQADQPFHPQWMEFIEFIDQQWSTGIDRLRGPELKDIVSEDELKSMIEVIENRRKEDDPDRNGFVEKLRNQVSHMRWRSQHEIAEEMMNATVECIRDIKPDLNVDSRKELNTAYEYPEPDICSTAKFARLLYSSSQGRACSAMVYDAFLCGEATVRNVVAKSTTRSIVGVDPKLVALIPPNNHLLFLSCRHGNGLEEPVFVQRNRDRWWEEQESNSSIFYFTPQGVIDGGSCFVHSGCIAHLLVFLTAPSVVRVQVLHCGENVINLCIRENGTELGRISDIQSTFRLHAFESFELPKGKHKLELIPRVHDVEHDFYLLRDILFEILQ